MTGMSRVSALLLRRRVASHPSMTGISRSIKIRSGPGRHRASFLAILRHQNLELISECEPHLEHVNIVLIVFDIQNSNHDTALVCTLERSEE